MKKYLIIIPLLLIIYKTRAICPTSSIIFTSQSQIDSFPINYPSCNIMPYDITIQESLPGAITNLNGLSQLHSILGYLDISNNSMLPNLTGMDSLNNVLGLNISNNSALTSFAGLNALSSIGESLEIYNNDLLLSISQLNNLTFIGYSITIGDNDILTNLNGLNSINSVGGTILIYHNIALQNLSGLNAITTIGGDLDIFQNDALTQIFNLNSLTNIGNNLKITLNNSLINLDGLNNLWFLGGDIQIFSNPSLVSLSALSGIMSFGSATITGDIFIVNCDALTTLTGLDNIDPASINHLYLYNSDNLIVCNVASVCNYLSNSNNTFTIYGNATNCTSNIAILSQCTNPTFSESTSISNTINIFPNPVTSYVTITGIQPFQKNLLEVTNVCGKIIYKGKISKNIFDLSHFENGIYCFRIFLKNAIVKKIIVKE